MRLVLYRFEIITNSARYLSEHVCRRGLPSLHVDYQTLILIVIGCRWILNCGHECGYFEKICKCQK